jgi:peptidoglycan/LPS O-acetylase OafA/YrhL
MSPNEISKIFGDANVLFSVSKIVKNRPVLDGLYVENFDGLRAVAALMVMSMHMHTIPHLAGGAPGVYIFFALSGYLLYSGFLRFSSEVNAKVIFAYLSRRIFRILPLYLFFVFVYAYLFKGWSLEAKNTFFLVQLFFLKGVLHLWTVRMEMILYLILPIIILFLYLLKKELYRLVALVIFSIIILILYHFIQFSFANSEHFMAIFVLGMASVHMRNYVPAKIAPYIAYFSISAILYLSTFAPWNSTVREFFLLSDRADIYHYPYVLYPLCALLVMSLSQFQSRVWGNMYLRIVGVCGYGYYLWHPMIIEMVRRWELSPFAYQVSAYSVTLVFAVVTFLIIEKPGIELGRKVSRWIMGNKRMLFGIRPWVIAVMIVMAFFSYRQQYLMDYRIRFAISMWSSKETIVKVYSDNGTGFSEKNAVAHQIGEGEWQTIVLAKKGDTPKRIRLDPGMTDGTYRLKEFKIIFPITKREVVLDRNKFVKLDGIQSIVNHEEYVEIIANIFTDDPILVYNKPIPRNFITWQLILFIKFIVGTLFLVIILSVINKIGISNANYQERRILPPKPNPLHMTGSQTD